MCKHMYLLCIFHINSVSHDYDNVKTTKNISNMLEVLQFEYVYTVHICMQSVHEPPSGETRQHLHQIQLIIINYARGRRGGEGTKGL